MDLISWSVDQRSSSEAKIALFRSLFRGRDDVYPRRDNKGALSLELRATMSLARLHRGRPRPAVIRDLILPVYEQFDEGFDTPDVREARSVLGLRADG